MNTSKSDGESQVFDKTQTYWNPYIAGTALGLVLFGSFFVAGSGLGASGGLSHILGTIVQKLSPNVCNHNLYFAPICGGAADSLDHRMVWMALGVILGGFVSGLAAGRLRPQTYKGPRIGIRTRWIFAFAGGSLMGWGAAMARGCTSGQALSGGAVLSVGSWVFMIMIFVGGYLLAWPMRRLWT
ncbi:MAG: hypothetical protein D6741_03830 [Planctomycetota bacterium]|nr:MAG: hypothetical protein D6741_03830 [Planctomycetota bacterium]